MSEYVKSNIFVGRNKEWNVVHSSIKSNNIPQLLCIYSEGKGGLGKTQLLLKALDAYPKQEGNVVIGQPMIDFYHLDMQRKVGVINALARQLALTESLNLIAAYRQKSLLSDDKTTIEQLFKKFAKEYHHHISKNNKKKFVFLFDSYEHIQHCTNKGASSTDYSRWLETELIPLLVNEYNVRVILAGRYLPTELDIPFDRLKIIPFSEDDATFFLKHAETLGKVGGIASEEAHELHRLTQGHPILLALAVDWLRHSYDPVKKLLAGVEQGEAFKNRLIKYIKQQLDKDQRFFLSSYITIAYQRLNADILHHLTGEEREDCEKYIKQIMTWSFIKPKGEDSVILHDVMHSLFDEYIINEDPEFYRDTLELLIGYYEKILFGKEQTLSATEQEQYILEMVGYTFQLDFHQGLEHFCTIFDQAMEDSRYNFARDLLRAAEGWEKRRKDGVDTLDFLKIDIRRIEYETESYANHQGALDRADKIIDEFKNDSRWNDSEFEGLILLKKGTALFGLARFNEAITVLKRAGAVLLENTRRVEGYWADNWIGYNYYQLGDFSNAEKYLNLSRKRFYGLAEKLLIKAQDWNAEIKNEYRTILQGYQISLVNLALIYFATGGLYKALNYGRIFLHITKNLQRNEREIARAQATLAAATWSAGYKIEAKQYLDDAGKRVANDPLLTGRITTERLQHSFDESGLSYSFLLESYRAEGFKNALGEISPPEPLSQLIKEAEENTSNLEKLGKSKELLTAYGVQANLYLLNVPNVSFEKIEKILIKGLQEDTATEELQRYEQFRFSGELVRLCYLATAWKEIPAASDAQKLAERFDYYNEQFLQLADELKEKNFQYPELLARYKIVLGNIDFDKALKKLDITLLEEAIRQYIDAADLLEKFTLFRDYSFKIIQHRLVTFIRKTVRENQRDILEDYSKIQNISQLSDNNKEYFSFIFNSTKICLSESYEELIEHGESIAYKERKNSIAIARRIILAKSFADALGIFLKSNVKITPDQELHLLGLRAMWLIQEARLYRYLRRGNINFSMRFFDNAKEIIENIEKKCGANSPEVLALQGRLDISKGTVLYRQGDYEEPIEFYLKDELPDVRKLFGKYGQAEFDNAKKLLFDGEKKLKAAQKLWNTVNPSPLNKLLRQQVEMWLGTAYFRIGEFNLLNGIFLGEQGALYYLYEAYKQCQKSNSHYRKVDAIESYLTAVSFYKPYDQSLIDFNPECTNFIKQIKEEEGNYPLISAKLRITQGDDLFTRLFVRDEEHSKERGVYQDVRYRLRNEFRTGQDCRELTKEALKKLRVMVNCYVKACKLMTSTDIKHNFTIAVRIIIRRTRMLLDADVIEEIHTIVDEAWDKYPKELGGFTNEKEAILAFSRVLEGLLK